MLTDFVQGDPTTPTPTVGTIPTSAWINSVEDLRYLFDNAVNAGRYNSGEMTDVALNAALVAAAAAYGLLPDGTAPIPLFVPAGSWSLAEPVDFTSVNCVPIFAPNAIFSCTGSGSIKVPRSLVVLGANPFSACLSVLTITGGNKIFNLQDETAARITADSTETAARTTAVTSETTRATAAEALLVRIDGSTPFTAVQSGVTPTGSAHLATKGYVDGALAGELTWAPYTPALSLSGATISDVNTKTCRFATKGKMIFIQFNILVVHWTGGSPESLNIGLPSPYTLSASMLSCFQPCWINNASTAQLGIATPFDAGDFAVGLPNSGLISTGFSCTGLFIGELA